MVTVLPAGDFEPSKYGLVNSRTLVTGSKRWESGFTQESTACMADVNLIDVCNTGLEELVIEKDGTGDTGDYLPFGVKATVECTVQGSLRTDWEARALAALEQCNNKAVELEFWEGRLSRAANDDTPNSNPNRFLANGDADDVTPTPGTAIKVRYGLALLEGKLADIGCGGRGYIHMPRSIASVLPLNEGRDGVLRTKLGNFVIAGDGYTGSGDDGVMPSGAAKWMYATGPVSVRLDNAEVVGLPAQNINTQINTINVSAERLAAVTWDGCVHLGVLVDLSLDYA